MDIQRVYAAFKECGKVTTDSRAISGGEMFFGLKGENFDGNEYALKALETGARYAVVDEGSAAAASRDPRLIVVPDTLEALQALARHHRENTFVEGKRLTVIGLTGTNGKTTTKELITRVLSVKYKVTSTQGNLNNDIGVPLSVLNINSETQLAVIEMGANHPDDIEKLVKVCEPDYGLITNVGKAHLLGFGSFEGVKKAKGKLYDYISEHGGSIFLNADDENLAAMAAERKGLKVIEYGIGYWNAMVLPSDAGLHFGVSLEDAIQAVSEYIPKNNRSQLEKTDRNILIEDAYNANPTSMAAALDNLATVQAAHKAVMIGDMRELGTESVAEHIAILKKLALMDLDLVCLVGEEFGKALGTIPEPAEGPLVRQCSPTIEMASNTKWFPTSDDLAAWLKENQIANHTILIKGSRGIRMEKILPEL